MADKRNRASNSSTESRDKRLKKKDVSLVESGDLCVSCSRAVGIECQWCRGWEHRECAGLTVGEYNMLGSSSSKIMFFCTLCYSKVPFALKVESESTNRYDILELKLKTAEDKLTDSLKKVGTI